MKHRNSDRRDAKDVEIDSTWVEVEVEALEVATTVAVAEEEENNLLQVGHRYQFGSRYAAAFIFLTLSSPDRSQGANDTT